MPQLLKPVRLEPMLHNEREATTIRSPHTATKSNPLLAATRESLRVAMNTQHSKKKKKKSESQALNVKCKTIELLEKIMYMKIFMI